MMQKRTLYLSFLLVSCLLLFSFSFASAQTVTFETKAVPRCSDIIVNVTVDSPTDISGLDIIFEVSGDYTSVGVAFAGGFGLSELVGPTDLGGGVYRMAAFRALGESCVTTPTGLLVAELSFHTADLCNGSISIVEASVAAGAYCVSAASTQLIACDLSALQTTVIPGSITFDNQLVSVVDCPTDTITVHWDTDVATFDLMATDADLATGCENLTFTILNGGPGGVTKTGDSTATFSWDPAGGDVCNTTITVEVMDKCGAADTCSRVICVYNDPPVATDPAAMLHTVWLVNLSDSAEASDPDGGPNSLLYTVLSFDGPTYHGNGLQLNNSNGLWSWDIGFGEDYTGYFELCIKVADGANLCDPCSPENADTVCFDIRVTGFLLTIEKVHGQLPGHYTTAGVYLDTAWANPVDSIGGFDLLITYDASILTSMGARRGDMIADDVAWEYFTYRHVNNCGGGCPSGLIRIVGMRESNDGVLNPNHFVGPGELVKLDFYVSPNYNNESQYIPIQFYWMDCGDNVLSDVSGNFLYLGLKVFTHEWVELTNPADWNLTGPMGYCFDTVYDTAGVYKNAPIGALILRNGGIDIIPIEDIDDRGDINLNGIVNEIADAVVFTNYFIYGADAFSINFEGQKAATEVNGDGVALTVADLVYLIRIIVGDVLPLPKVNPSAYAEFASQGRLITVETNTEIGAALMVFDGLITPMLADDAAHMEMVYNHTENSTRVLIFPSMTAGGSITDGNLLHIDGFASLISLEAAEYNGATLKVDNKVLPTEYVLEQNYPNPFNPTTTILMELPKASDWMISIYNVAGQRVAEYSGHSNAGIVSVEWDAAGFASGLYFYKAEAGAFKATKKMVLLK